MTKYSMGAILIPIVNDIQKLVGYYILCIYIATTVIVFYIGGRGTDEY